MSEERQELALDAVDSVLNIAETDGILHYPCLRDWNNARQQSFEWVNDVQKAAFTH